MSKIWVVINVVLIAITIGLLFTGGRNFLLIMSLFCFGFAIKDFIFYVKGYGIKHFWSNKNIAWPDPFGSRNLTKPTKATDGEKLFLLGGSLSGIILGSGLLFFYFK